MVVYTRSTIKMLWFFLPLEQFSLANRHLKTCQDKQNELRHGSRNDVVMSRWD